ncbi:5-amino-6-(5-phospho-D-ribitylamino)uracil phosphatase YitU [Austwickia sp. TVS 96-490-7B]|uniref:HAD family hydrolase n=1 Tax=Austwickia sp. TVS 96-490-7B TaxID=2830843 RepID=UPI001C566177|nr:HAD family hydrolase [Austwickia sp. TVS 96-490-7B]MBW3086427.1 5-amino-6-(5-phospho-D-ribitylamino)uracil phosphatase YitU [Austwickia sp. TVS 96-490-7B]
MTSTDLVGRADWESVIAHAAFPAVLATDLDGTLLRSDGSVSDFTRHIVRRYLLAGGEHVMVTARPPRWLTAVAPMVPAGGVILAANGAFVVSAGDGAIVEQHTFVPTAVTELVTRLKQHFPKMVLAVESSTGLVREAGFAADPRDDPSLVVDDLRDWFAGADGSGGGKLLGRCPDVPGDQVYALVGAVVEDRAHLAFSGAAGLLELTSPEVTKARALARWCQDRGHIAAQVWSFGDMPNDLPMLGWSGLSFAPINAHPQVAAKVSAVIPHHDEDGVGQVVARCMSLAAG